MGKRILTICMSIIMVMSCIPVKAVYGIAEHNNKIQSYKISSWSSEAKNEYVRLLTNLHRNVNKERPDLKLAPAVEWRDDLEFVSKVKLEYQYKYNLSKSFEDYNPHVYHKRPEPYNKLKDEMNGYFLETGNYVLSGQPKPYFYLENEAMRISSGNIQVTKDMVKDIIVGYLTEENNHADSVGHATALLGARGIGSAYNLFDVVNGPSGLVNGFHEIESYEGNNINRSCNNDDELTAFAYEKFYHNENNVLKYLENRDVQITEKSFPDEHFRKYVIEKADKNKDGFLTNEECNDITTMYLDDMDIKTLTGIGNFKMLKTLYCRDNKLTIVNVNNNPELENMYFTETKVIKGENTFYYDEDGDIAKGFTKIKDNTYYFNKDGHMLKGKWIINNVPYFFKSNGIVAEKGWYTTPKGFRVYSYGEGILATGKVKIYPYTYYFSKYGVMQKGFRQINNFTYYFNNMGRMLTGHWTINKVPYYFKSNGIAAGKGWYTTPKGWRVYSLGKGKLVTGLKKVSGYTYYFGNNGIVHKGRWMINNKPYYFSSNGRTAKKGWIYINGKKTYYCTGNGRLATGRIKVNGTYFSFNNKGFVV